MVDVSNPAEPRLVTSWGPEGDVAWNSGIVADEILVDGFLYLALSDTYANNGLWVVDVSDPANPRERGTFNVLSSAHNVVGIGEYAYVTSGYFPDYLNLIDTTDLNNVQDRGIVLFVRQGEMALVNGYLYLPGYASREDRVRILDVTDPASPQRLDEIAPDFGDFFYLSTVDDYACVPILNYSLRFFDLAEPSAPRQISQLDAEGIRQVACAENVAYYVSTDYDDHLSVLHIVDVSDLADPRESGVIDLPENVYDIAFADEYVYVIADCGIDCQNAELVVIDVSDEAHPHQVGSLTDVLDGLTGSMSLAGHYAYVVDGDIWIIDVSDPTKPYPVGYLGTPGYASGIAVMNDALFVADSSGFVIVRVQD